jgi:hypothetical protein
MLCSILRMVNPWLKMGIGIHHFFLAGLKPPTITNSSKRITTSVLWNPKWLAEFRAAFRLCSRLHRGLGAEPPGLHCGSGEDAAAGAPGMRRFKIATYRHDQPVMMGEYSYKHLNLVIYIYNYKNINLICSMKSIYGSKHRHLKLLHLGLVLGTPRGGDWSRIPAVFLV